MRCGPGCSPPWQPPSSPAASCPSPSRPGRWKGNAGTWRTGCPPSSSRAAPPARRCCSRWANPTGSPTKSAGSPTTPRALWAASPSTASPRAAIRARRAGSSAPTTPSPGGSWCCASTRRASSARPNSSNRGIAGYRCSTWSVPIRMRSACCSLVRPCRPTARPCARSCRPSRTSGCARASSPPHARFTGSGTRRWPASPTGRCTAGPPRRPTAPPARCCCAGRPPTSIRPTGPPAKRPPSAAGRWLRRRRRVAYACPDTRDEPRSIAAGASALSSFSITPVPRRRRAAASSQAMR